MGWSTYVLSLTDPTVRRLKSDLGRETAWREPCWLAEWVSAWGGCGGLQAGALLRPEGWHAGGLEGGRQDGALGGFWQACPERQGGVRKGEEGSAQ